MLYAVIESEGQKKKEKKNEKVRKLSSGLKPFLPFGANARAPRLAPLTPGGVFRRRYLLSVTVGEGEFIDYRGNFRR